MIVADDFQPAGARGAMDVDKRLRIDLEVAGRFGVHVGARPDFLDEIPSPEQHTACFVRMRRAGLCQKLPDQRA